MIRLTAAPLALLALAAGCSRGGAGGAPKHVPVAVARAEQRAVPYEILATGTVEPRQTVSVQAQVTGVLTSVAFREGETSRDRSGAVSNRPPSVQAAAKRRPGWRETQRATNAR
jgi:multidrug efflux system membrane fusion protein